MIRSPQHTCIVGQDYTFWWTATGVTPPSTIQFCYDTDGTWNGNETWFDVTGVPGANGTFSYTWHTAGLAAGTYYIGACMYQDQVGGNLTQFTDRQGHTTTYTYTDYSNLSTVTQNNDASTTADDQVTTYYYDTDASGKNSFLTKVVDAANDVTQYTYNNATYKAWGLPDSMISPNGYGHTSGYTTCYDYNSAGQTTFEYTPFSTTNTTSKPTPTGYAGYIKTSFTYDSRGNLLTSADGDGNTTSYTYDTLDRRLTQTSPDPDGSGPLEAQVTTYTYDGVGNMIAAQVKTATSGVVLSSMGATYDNMKRLTKSVNPDGTYTTNEYDPAGNLVATSDALGRVTRYVYDDRNRCIAVIAPDGSVTRTEYDGGGRVVATTDANGNTTQYKYDVLGRETEEILPDPDGGGSLGSPIVLYKYDSRGNLQYVTNTYAKDAKLARGNCRRPELLCHLYV